MPRTGKRRAPVESDHEDETPAARPSRTDEGSAQPSEYEGEEADTPPLEQHVGSSTTEQQMVKSLVRLALASEHSRTPLRRTDISQKVMSDHPRQFNRVFEGAQQTLRHVFAMELVELQAKERVTIRQRMAAAQKSQASQSAAVANKSWVLRSTLPSQFRTAAIISPPRAPTEKLESAYIALYTFIITLILLSGGTLAEAKLERHLRRTNTETSTPVDRTDRVLARMIKDGYIVKIRDTSGGEEMVEYMVGPRGKAEVGEKGVRGLVNAVYGPQADEELEKKIERSLRISAVRMQPVQAVGADGTTTATPAAAAAAAAATGAGAGAGAGAITPRPRGRPRKHPNTRGNGGGTGDDDEYGE